jgi:ketosteroid isomerase-like protein
VSADAGALPAMEPPMDVQEAVRRDLRAFNARDAEAELSLFSADAELVDPDVRLRGRQAVADFAHAWWEAFPDARVTPERETIAGCIGLVEGTFTGTHVATLRTPAATVPPSGRRIANRFAAVYEVRDGFIASRRLYFDRSAVLGVPGDKPTEGERHERDEPCNDDPR